MTGLVGNSEFCFPSISRSMFPGSSLYLEVDQRTLGTRLASCMLNLHVFAILFSKSIKLSLNGRLNIKQLLTQEKRQYFTTINNAYIHIFMAKNNWEHSVHKTIRKKA